MSHRARVYHNIESLARITHARRARRRWKLHLEKHGNVPLVDKCSICREHDAKSTPRRYLEGEERIPKRVRDLTE